MATTLRSPAILCFLFLFFAVSSALDMSIITYDQNHGQIDSFTGRTNDELMGIYERWLAHHGKAYNAVGEKERRFEIFKDNLRFIEEHNSEEKRSYEVGLNQFADLTNEEYRSMYLGAKMDLNKKKLNSSKSHRYAFQAGDNLPESVDWRANGAVSPVRNQGSCGSCWAFSTVAAVEGINQIVTGNRISLSEQELIDCDTSYNKGCNGGRMEQAFIFILKNGGIDTGIDYPYKAAKGICDQNKKNTKVVSIDGYGVVPSNDEKSLQKAVAHQPISVAIESAGRPFQLYTKGIFTGECGVQLDHAVVVVGYGTENGIDYWIVRNSWSPYWGEKGYIRMERNIRSSSGKCGIALRGSYPIKTGSRMGKH